MLVDIVSVQSKNIDSRPDTRTVADVQCLQTLVNPVLVQDNNNCTALKMAALQI